MSSLDGNHPSLETISCARQMHCKAPNHITIHLASPELTLAGHGTKTTHLTIKAGLDSRNRLTENRSDCSGFASCLFYPDLRLFFAFHTLPDSPLQILISLPLFLCQERQTWFLSQPSSDLCRISHLRASISIPSLHPTSRIFSIVIRPCDRVVQLDIEHSTCPMLPRNNSFTRLGPNEA